MAKFRKKSAVIEAVQWTGMNVGEVLSFVGGEGSAKFGKFFIPTLAGTMTALAGDWIIRGVSGEFYPCEPDIFAKTYEPVATEQEANL